MDSRGNGLILQKGEPTQINTKLVSSAKTCHRGCKRRRDKWFRMAAAVRCYCVAALNLVQTWWSGAEALGYSTNPALTRRSTTGGLQFVRLMLPKTILIARISTLFKADLQTDAGGLKCRMVISINLHKWWFEELSTMEDLTEPCRRKAVSNKQISPYLICCNLQVSQPLFFSQIHVCIYCIYVFCCEFSFYS